MSSSALMSIGMKAMTASYAALTTTGHNIANANVAGYSKQTAELATAAGQYTGAGFFGKGVDVTTVSRAHDELLTREAATSRSLAAMDSTRLSMLNQLETVFPVGEQGVGYAVGQFLNSMVDLSAQPSDAATRQVVLDNAAQAAGRFAAAGTQLDALQGTVRGNLEATVAQVNQLASGIAGLNQRIADLVGRGQPPNDLLDQRDKLINDLSQHLQLSTVAAGDGTVAVFIGGGQRLVLGSQASALAVQADPADASRAALALSENGLPRVLAAQDLGGGSIAGLLNFQNNDLVDARNRLGQLAATLSRSVNGQQALGLDLGNPSGSGAPVFAVGAPQALPNAHNATDATGRFIGQVSLAVSDASQLVASDYALRADPGGAAGVWQLTRLSDGLVRSIASGDSVDGMTITVGPPAPGPGDRFLLQPVARAAIGMQRVLDDPKGLAAASPVTASVAAGNSGTASVASLRVADASLDPNLDASIRFTSDSGDYAWELRDHASNALVSSGSGTWNAAAPIALNGFELQLAGVPKSGDSLDVKPTAYVSVNNGNALAMADLRDRALVGRAPLAGGGIGGGANFTDAYASLMAQVGTRVQGAQAASDISSAVAGQAEQARSARSGVNLDEEAARLIQFQQSYQAAAKVLQVAQSVFQTLIDAAGQ